MINFMYRLQCPICEHKQIIKLNTKQKEPEYYFSPTQGIGGRIECKKCKGVCSASAWCESIYVPKPIFKY